MRYLSEYIHYKKIYLFYPWSCGDHSVGKQEEIQPNFLKYVLKDADHLQSQHVLPDVVANFENSGLPCLFFRIFLALDFPVGRHR